MHTSDTIINNVNSIMLVVAEPSGDILAANILKGLYTQGFNYPIWGIGGYHLSKLGMECLFNIDALSVRGYIEVLPVLPRLWFMRRLLMNQAAIRRPNLCITVDAPDFNLILANKLKSIGIPTIHFISPSIWAWRRERLFAIKAAIDTMLCIFPQEPVLYHNVGMSAYYVGHPMAYKIPLHLDKYQAKQSLYSILLHLIPIKNNQKHIEPVEKQSIQHITHHPIDYFISSNPIFVAILPGSRSTELKYILNTQLSAARLLLKKNKHFYFIIPIVNESLMEQAKLILVQYSDLPITLLLKQTELILAGSDIGLIASGTATLEAALYRLPMVICYKMPYISWLIMRKKNYLPWIGLPNILCQTNIVPEFVQYAANPIALSDALWQLLYDEQRKKRMCEQFQSLHQNLYRDTSLLIARIILRKWRLKN